VVVVVLGEERAMSEDYPRGALMPTVGGRDWDAWLLHISWIDNEGRMQSTDVRFSFPDQGRHEIIVEVNAAEVARVPTAGEDGKDWGKVLRKILQQED
jgi:hypothetical protein